jgi:hypothetical protein
LPRPDNKKKEEWAIMESFREHLPGFPNGMLSASESPDFILGLGPRNKIGIELTRLHMQVRAKDPFSPENISACIRQKENKLWLYYRKKLREYWLILFVLDPAFIPAYNINNKLGKWVFQSEYKRVFLFLPKTGNILDLNLSERG